jgi:hypothetical protein
MSAQGLGRYHHPTRAARAGTPVPLLGSEVLAASLIYGQALQNSTNLERHSLRQNSNLRGYLASRLVTRIESQPVQC